MRAIIPLILFLIGVLSAGATPQMPDRIEYDDKVFEFGVESNSPLESFLQKEPARWPKEFPKSGSGSGLWSSALWRGHVALYRVVQGKLWLVSIEVPVSNEEFVPAMGRYIDDRPYAPFPLTRLFPDCAGAVHTGWFSGDLKLTRPPSTAELSIDKSLSTRHEILIFKDGILTHSTKSVTEVNSVR